MFEEHPAEGKQTVFKGSMIIYTVKDAEEAWELIRNDIYAKSDVWDLEKAQVIPVSLPRGYWLRWRFSWLTVECVVHFCRPPGAVDESTYEFMNSIESIAVSTIAVVSVMSRPRDVRPLVLMAAGASQQMKTFIYERDVSEPPPGRDFPKTN